MRPVPVTSLIILICPKKSAFHRRKVCIVRPRLVAVDCTRINDHNKGNDNCNNIVAHKEMSFVYYNCMDDPSSPDGTCANKNVCEYENGNHP